MYHLEPERRDTQSNIFRCTMSVSLSVLLPYPTTFY